MLNAESCCIILVDVQEKLTAVMHNREELVKNIQILLNSAKLLDIPLIWCQQYPKALGQTVSELAEILHDSKPIDKTSFSCTGHNEFNEIINLFAPEHLIVVGIEAHICVYQTAIKLKEKGYKVQVPADMISSRKPENVQIAIERMKQHGIEISSLEMLLFELLKDAKHEHFKAISKMIK